MKLTEITPSKALLQFMNEERERSNKKHGAFEIIDPETIKQERSDAYDYMF